MAEMVERTSNIESMAAVGRLFLSVLTLAIWAAFQCFWSLMIADGVGLFKFGASSKWYFGLYGMVMSWICFAAAKAILTAVWYGPKRRRHDPA